MGIIYLTTTSARTNVGLVQGRITRTLLEKEISLTTKSVGAPADLVIAVLNKVGEGVRIADNTQLAKLFNDAAERDPETFGFFAWHPRYRDCPLLAQVLHRLDMGGCIERFNAASDFYQATAFTLEAYGSGKFKALTPDQQESVVKLAKSIENEFGK